MPQKLVLVRDRHTVYLSGFLSFYPIQMGPNCPRDIYNFPFHLTRWIAEHTTGIFMIDHRHVFGTFVIALIPFLCILCVRTKISRTSVTALIHAYGKCEMKLVFYIKQLDLL